MSSILNNQAYADVNTSGSNNNSQTMDLLQANVSSAQVFQDNKDPKVDPSAVNIVADNSLLPATSSMGTSAGSDASDSTTPDQTSVYVIRKGDSIAKIADMFGVSTNTILWANDMKKGDPLVPGNVLLILPVSGLEHTVTKGQTLKGIAALYKADINEIIQSNDITLDTQLNVGDKLIIPNAEKAEETDKPIKNLKDSTAKDKKYYDLHPAKNLSGYYIDPVPGCRLTQGLHDGNAVDLGCPTGTPIYAAAAGTVIFAKLGNNGGYGNLVIISHPNGTETLYAHQSAILTHPGEQVSQGEAIGAVGSTGRSTGPHLHFEVKGARNPGADGSWAH